MRLPGCPTRRGAVTVEATLLLPLFLIFWFGIVDWGITYWVHERIVHNANMAARWAVVHTWNPDAIRNMVVYGGTTGSGTGAFGLSAQGNADGTGANVEVMLRCMTTLNPALQSGTTCLAEDWSTSRWIEIVVHDYTWTHFTPYFVGTYTGRPVTVSLPAEGLGAT
jgi:Flp pilus assembly protein TadG